MRHENTVFHGLLKVLPRRRFEQVVERFKSDWRTRRLPSWSQLVALVYAQFSGATSLREIEAGLLSHRTQLYHLGIKDKICRSTLADANAARQPELYEEIFEGLLGELGQRQVSKETVRLIDATSIRLNLALNDWAHFAARDHAGVKLHICYDPAEQVPTYFAVSPARSADILAARAMPILPGACYVFDLGYYDFAFWAALDAAGCRLVTRLKCTTKPELIRARRIPKAEARPREGRSTILEDRIVHLGPNAGKKKPNPWRKPLREVVVALEDGRTLRLATNDLRSSARTIADLYKTRWQIELFFKWIKQNLRIKRFVGNSENAVRIQLATALIAYLLLAIVRKISRIKVSLHAFASLMRVNLMHRRSLQQIFDPSPPKTSLSPKSTFSQQLALPHAFA
jgi:hypothetical protein